ncbi:MAG: hypothetical protein A2Y34_15835 [Spirochaetes bacterium GWC1_27_15]|nr:MAG: hypothetical protein A2Z98_04470 [Spirochaetes bacterium GWB1_27_13]OHD27341.1 MAG: hypothetical protein A2Y34_15835 [Spirochaetes bacterium GWC1_27_15]
MEDIILIVDDSATVRTMLSKILQDYNLLFAKSGFEMWEVLKNEKPSLILLDIMLPDTTGFDLIKELTENPDYKNIPIIFVTQSTERDDLKKGFDLGGMDYVRKPFDEVELKVRINSALKIKKLENKLRVMSTTDFLTGIYNRRYFYEVANNNLFHIIRKKRTLTMAIIDIDLFKSVNDNYGHDCGDFVLKEFAKFIKESIRVYDVFARFGGEEFIIQFVETDKILAKTVLDRIRQNLTNKTFQFNNKEIQFSFSAGVAELNEVDNQGDIDSLIKIADSRLYIAKKTGRNKIVDADEY